MNTPPGVDEVARMVEVPSRMNTWFEVLRPMRNWAAAAAVLNERSGWLPETLSGSSTLSANPSVSVLVPAKVREALRVELPLCRRHCPAKRPVGSVAPLVELIVQSDAATFATLA
jgi:hypothetical protein